jgi:hypothetical protein
MGLLRGIARTAAIAGTATVVSNRVSRRQQGRWAAKEQKAADEQQAQEAQQQPQYAQQPPPQYAQQPQYAPPPQYAQQPQYAEQPQYDQAPAAPSTDDMLEQLQKLGELKTAGVLTEAEFQAQKAKILAR